MSNNVNNIDDESIINNEQTINEDGIIPSNTNNKRKVKKKSSSKHSDRANTPPSESSKNSSGSYRSEWNKGEFVYPDVPNTSTQSYFTPQDLEYVDNSTQRVHYSILFESKHVNPMGSRGSSYRNGVYKQISRLQDLPLWKEASLGSQEAFPVEMLESYFQLVADNVALLTILQSMQENCADYKDRRIFEGNIQLVECLSAMYSKVDFSRSALWSKINELAEELTHWYLPPEVVSLIQNEYHIRVIPSKNDQVLLFGSLLIPLSQDYINTGNMSVSRGRSNDEELFSFPNDDRLWKGNAFNKFISIVTYQLNLLKGARSANGELIEVNRSFKSVVSSWSVCISPVDRKIAGNKVRTLSSGEILRYTNSPCIYPSYSEIKYAEYAFYKPRLLKEKQKSILYSIARQPGSTVAKYATNATVRINDSAIPDTIEVIQKRQYSQHEVWYTKPEGFTYTPEELLQMTLVYSVDSSSSCLNYNNAGNIVEPGIVTPSNGVHGLCLLNYSNPLPSSLLSNSLELDASSGFVDGLTKNLNAIGFISGLRYSFNKEIKEGTPSYDVNVNYISSPNMRKGLIDFNILTKTMFDLAFKHWNAPTLEEAFNSVQERDIRPDDLVYKIKEYDSGVK